jgi:hypothetical protein
MSNKNVFLKFFPVSIFSMNLSPFLINIFFYYFKT